MKRNMYLAFILGVFPGLGQLYNGQAGRALVHVIMQNIFACICFLMMILIPGHRFLNVTLYAAGFSLFRIYSMVDAACYSRKIKSSFVLTRFNKWYSYLLFLLLSVLLQLGFSYGSRDYLMSFHKVPTGAMENTIEVGDLVGADVISKKFGRSPGINEVWVFRYPGDDAQKGKPKEFIKRCVAVSGDTVQIKEKQLFVNNKIVLLPANAKHVDSRVLPPEMDLRDNCGPYVLPKVGHVYKIDSLSFAEFCIVRSLIYQENQKTKLKTIIRVIVGDSLITVINQDGSSYVKYSEWDSHAFAQQLKLYAEKAGASYSIEKELYLDGKKISEYFVKYKSYFMMGDNRDNSLDSRYWGFVSKNNFKSRVIFKYKSLFNSFGVPVK